MSDETQQAQHVGVGRLTGGTHKGPYYGWVLMVVLGMTTIISYGTTQYLFGVLVVPVSTTFHWSQASLSGAYTVGLILAGLLGVPIGHLVDRWGARVLMTCGSLLGGLSLIGLASIHNIVAFYLWWSLGLGLATALTFYPVSFTVVTNWFEHKRGTALAVLTLIGGLSSPLFIPSEGWMVEHLGWRSMLVLLGLSQLVIALPLHAVLLRRHPEDLGLSPDGVMAAMAIRIPKPGQLPGITLNQAFRLPAFWLLTIALSLTMLGSTIVQVYQIPSLITRGYDPVVAASVAGGLGLASLPGRVILNLLSERISPHFLLCGSIVAQAAGMILLIFAPSLGWLLVYVLLYGAAYGAILPLRATVMAEHMGRRAYGSILAWQGIAVALSSGIGLVLAGWLYDTLHTYTMAFWICVGVFLLATLSIALTPPPMTSREES